MKLRINNGSHTWCQFRRLGLEHGHGHASGEYAVRPVHITVRSFAILAAVSFENLGEL